ncbi:MAG TPA: aminoacetone oxidase family FAD-binding enzyme [Bacteroidota bacterium]|nr:aminoacetone oxidase family FAD-binding enzyme [Bacteroidota bacterium]
MGVISNSILIIGAGGAGLIAAWKAASMGAPVLLLERNSKPGVKILISGGGKCNVTHDGPMEEMGKAFLRREDRFLKYAFRSFTNDDVRTLLAENGVPTFVRPDGRVFPRSLRAADVVGALAELVRASGAEIRLNARVTGILSDGEAVAGVALGGEKIGSTRVILTTGGASYKKTGTTGDGITWGAELSHSIVPLRAALAPIRVHPALPAEWRGIAVRGGRLSLHRGGRRIDSFSGDILFTHEGISGPAALGLSRSAALALEESGVSVHLDFFPASDFTELDSGLNRLILANRGKQIDSLLCSFLPDRIVHFLLASVQVSPLTRGHVLTRDARRRIVGLLKSWEIGTINGIDMDRGEVTAGGISLDDIVPQTMESRKVRQLYVAGEVLDIAGPIGGYNLQAAFSTGFVAGMSAARNWLKSSGDDPHEPGSYQLRKG